MRASCRTDLAPSPHVEVVADGRSQFNSLLFVAGGRTSSRHRGVRAELARENILVTTVCPGLMRTGSPLNALFKGKRTEEYAWFAVSSSLPVATISAERAARQILAACRRGEAELMITPQAKLAIVARAVAPALFGIVMSVMNRLLPAAAGPQGDTAQPGRERRARNGDFVAPGAYARGGAET